MPRPVSATAIGTSFGHGLERVLDEVPEDLLELARIAIVADVRRKKVPGDLDFAVELAAAPEDLEGLVEDIGQADHREDLLGREGEVEELVEAVGDTLRFLEDDVHQTPLFGAEDEVLLQDLD